MKKARFGWSGLLTTMVLIVASCGDSDPATVSNTPSANAESGASAGQVDRSLTRDDLDCSPEVLGDSNDAPTFAAHYVVDGALGAVCLGEEDPTLVRAFEELAVITPPAQLSDMGLFAGFTWEGGDDATLAFVTPADDDGSQFVMAVGLNSYDDDPAEASLTMAHEFSHIFTGSQLQLDRGVGPDECATYWNGEGCYLEGSVMAEWIAEFWPPDLLGQIDPQRTDVSTDDGAQRCALNDSFFGSYGATNPEEDFAEAFSSFVYEVPAATDGQQTKLDWIATKPGLAEFRDRAAAAGLTPLENNFEVCGTGE